VELEFANKEHREFHRKLVKLYERYHELWSHFEALYDTARQLTQLGEPLFDARLYKNESEGLFDVAFAGCTVRFIFSWDPRAPQKGRITCCRLDPRLNKEAVAEGASRPKAEVVIEEFLFMPSGATEIKLPPNGDTPNLSTEKEARYLMTYLVHEALTRTGSN
jgi:hypothetical protein